MKQTFETTERAIALVMTDRVLGLGHVFIFFAKNVAKNVENHCSTYIITYFSDDSRYIIKSNTFFVKMFSRKIQTHH